MKHLILVVLLCTAAISFGQTLLPSQPLHIGLDVARFRGADDTTASLEVYYSVPQTSVTYRADSAGFLGGIDVTILVKQKDTLRHAERWLVPAVVKDTSTMQSSVNLVGVYTISAGRGEYTVKLICRDRFNMQRKDSAAIRFPLVPVGSGKVQFGDIELASSIKQTTQQGPFYKNTLEVVPNVGGLYSSTQPLYYYTEAYNLLSGDDRTDLKLRGVINDAVGTEITAHEKTRKRAAESSVLIDQFPLGRLHSGTYVLTVSLSDTSKNVLATAKRKFYVFNPALGVDSSLIRGSVGLPLVELDGLDEEALDEEFRQAKYEMMDDENAQYKKLQGADAKRKFLTAFWRKRPPGFRDGYMERIRHANSAFGYLGKKGYRSDRGRVYVMYGPPDDVERHANESDSKPFEVWTYNNIQGGVEFDFVLRNSTGDYELVNSTHRNELHDDNWQRYTSPQ
jgi:GWxTD domain-containing protein